MGDGNGIGVGESHYHLAPAWLFWLYINRVTRPLLFTTTNAAPVAFYCKFLVLLEPFSWPITTHPLCFTTTNSILNSPPQLPGAAGAWGSLFAVQEPVKPRHVSAAASKKQPAAYGIKRNLEMCTEALGCETGGVDAAADDVADEGADRKRRAREEVEEIMTKVKTSTERERRALPPPLTTLAGGASRMRMVPERRDGRLEVYAVRTSGMQAERSGGRLRLRFLPCDGCNAAAVCSRQEPQEAEKTEEVVDQEEEEEEYGVAKYARGRRCLETAARCGKTWEPEQAAPFWVAIT